MLCGTYTKPRIAKTISKKKKMGGITPSYLGLLYSYSNQDSMILMEQKIPRSTEQNKEPINILTQCN